jgi:hypothetical protein
MLRIIGNSNKFAGGYGYDYNKKPPHHPDKAVLANQ